MAGIESPISRLPGVDLGAGGVSDVENMQAGTEKKFKKRIDWSIKSCDSGGEVKHMNVKHRIEEAMFLGVGACLRGQFAFSCRSAC